MDWFGEASQTIFSVVCILLLWSALAQQQEARLHLMHLLRE
jgi:hypothetical protein